MQFVALLKSYKLALVQIWALNINYWYLSALPLCYCHCPTCQSAAPNLFRLKIFFKDKHNSLLPQVFPYEESLNLRLICWTSKSDLSSATKCDQIQNNLWCESGHNLLHCLTPTNRPLVQIWTLIIEVRGQKLGPFVNANAQPAQVLHQTAGIDPKFKKAKNIFKDKHSSLLPSSILLWIISIT